MSVSAELRRLVRDRADNCCEYCRMPQEFDPATFEIDHVVPEKMNGPTSLENLALACFKCNNHKGPNIAGIDPESRARTFLFDPRADTWTNHFRLENALIVGTTPVGRATVDLLQFNASHRLAHRRQLIFEGVFPQPGT